MTTALDLTAIGDDLDDDDSVCIGVRVALAPYQPSPAEELFLDPNEGGALDQATIDWLARHGVRIDALFFAPAVRAAHVRFDHRGRYAPNVLGELALILPVLGQDGIQDWCAWAIRSGTTATRLGRGAMLGGELVGRDTGDGVTIAPLTVFTSPLGWLRARRRGIVILDPGSAAFALAGVALYALDNQHANDLRRALRVLPAIVRVRHLERLAA